MVTNMGRDLLTIWQDEVKLAILIALFDWNPRTLEQLSSDINIRENVITEKLGDLKSLSLVEEKGETFEISRTGKIYVEGLGLTKDIIRKELARA